MHIPNVNEVIEAIQNHSALKLAGIRFPERLGELERRCQQLGGMIEITRRLKLDRRLERALEAHRGALKREIEG
ncbi:MAG: hypothetical protein JWQ90_4181 [Hydrocarboniphaga sp.]|uniref:hypothetical protein n=1 Tax=Hydrocarboniphaga sp. TaxID=2033016 RepID=UPI00260D5E25|nr:hypothetical protein [Hydrocarboniphaga sp.]MDB5971731.1 hypothetical protein [Hydrocarboniphaga sp.]